MAHGKIKLIDACYHSVDFTKITAHEKVLQISFNQNLTNFVGQKSKEKPD
jgi:hypothetical protein